jgi:hypothetical protein
MPALKDLKCLAPRYTDAPLSFVLLAGKGNRMEKTKKIIFLLVIFFLGLILSGCSFVRVQNLSDVNVRVSVTVPDTGTASTRLVRSGQIVDVFSTHGGRYTVTTLPDEQYREFLEEIRNAVTQRLYDERDTLTAEDVATLVQRLEDVDQALDGMAQVGASCAGQLPDYETAVVTIAWDTESNNWELQCQ